MKPGKSIAELASTLDDIRKHSKDFLVPAAKLSMNQLGELLIDGASKDQTFTPNGYSHGQIASYASVPKQYYDRLMEENLELLARNVNHGISAQEKAGGRNGKPETRMIRTYKDKARALLSSSYRRLDAYDLCQTVLPVMADHRLEIASSEITDRRLYIKALSPTLKTEIKKGDVVQYGVVVSTSDVGAGELAIEGLCMRLICLNGQIMNTGIRARHVGKNMAEEDVQELLSTETINLTDQAFWARVRDVLIATMDPKRFEAEAQRFRDAADRKITNFDIPEVVELTAKEIGITGERNLENMVAYLANGADGAGLTQWGLMNAVTFAAQQDSVNYDTSIIMERSASKILELDSRQWRRIAEVS